jgi:hypothetical protein
MSCHVDNFDTTKLVNFGIIQIWERALNWFIMEPVRERLLDICHLCGLGGNMISSTCFLLLIPMCK